MNDTLNGYISFSTDIGLIFLHFCRYRKLVCVDTSGGSGLSFSVGNGTEVGWGKNSTLRNVNDASTRQVSSIWKVLR